MMTLRDYIPYYRRNLRAAAPVVMTQLCAALGGLIDTIMVGRYGTTELAAVSFAHSIFITFMVFCMGATMGLTPLVGYAYVQGDETRLRDLMRGGFLFECVLIGVMTVVLLLFVPLLPYLGQDPEVVRVARPYFYLCIVGVAPFMLFHLLKQFLEGLGNTLAAMVVALVVNLINVPLNYMLIFGRWGAPELGATGAGIATLVVRVLMPLALLAIMLSRPAWRTYFQREATNAKRPTCNDHRTATIFREVARLGLPIGLQQLMEILSFTLAIVMVGWISKEAVAAHQIVNQLSSLTFMVSIGIGAATTIRVAHQYGAGRMHDMRMAARASMHLALVWSVVCAAVLIGWHTLIPTFFTHDMAVARMAAPLMILCGVYQISDALQCVGGAMLRGISDVRVPMYIAFVTYILITLPLGYVLMFPAGMGLQGLWIAFLVGLTIAAVLLLSRFWRLANSLMDKQI